MGVISVNGIGNLTRVTLYLDDTTTEAIKNDICSIKGKAVTITDSNTVGYGTASNPIFGIVTVVEPQTMSNDKLIVGVGTNGFFTDLESTGVAVGDYLACDGSGGFAKSTTATNAQVTALDTDTNMTTIFLR
ncbi:MAG: hypothetical protein HFE57_03530 [Firmicutes bacterium]|nr:hypothetical protein [Bacillota bacterium]